MKRLLTTIFFVSGILGLLVQKTFAQEDSVTTASTTTITAVKKTKKSKTFSASLGFGRDDIEKKDSTKRIEASKGRFIGGITFTRVDLGFSRLVDNGSFNLSPDNDFLEYKGGKRVLFLSILYN